MLKLFSDAPQPATDSRAVVANVNQARAEHGLPALRYSLRLSRGSKRWSRHLRRVGYLVHSHGLRGRYRTRGEVLSSGWSDPVKAWLDSPPHRAIVLGRWPRVIGAGKAGDTWTARFVEPRKRRKRHGK